MKLAKCSLRDWLRNVKINVSKNKKNIEINKHCYLIYKEQILSFIKDILLGCIYLHDIGCVHADIKLGNILVLDNEQQQFGLKYKVVLGDCGFVCPQRYAKTAYTTPIYRDPKITQSWHHDIYSLGIVFLELLTFQRVQEIPTHEDIREFSNNVDSKFQPLIRNMTNPLLNKRPTAREIYKNIFREEAPIMREDLRFTVGNNMFDNKTYIKNWKKIKYFITSNNLNNIRGLEYSFAYWLGEDITRLEKIFIYACAFIFIYRSLYNINRRRKKFDLEEILQYFYLESNKQEVIYTIEEILKDADICRLIFSWVEEK